ncbi:barstar family protein [Streptomyces sp. NPDC054884]|uniref:barstar family protein n=1 Tax=Streptomyces sp. ME08-AFT2 TaxID=3028683 RepID=UPI0029A0F53C|nr:barstar family protein [Streptomyces sp. ME08-AFT2]MDX3313248.1 barstar family protein [Streptomyces sp. ME08-AFT2]
MTEHVLTLDLDGVTDKAELMDRCARHLELPDRFARNWDALADSLTGLPDGPEEGPVLVIVRNWRSYAKERPEEWEIAQEVLAAAADRAPALSVVLALGGSS